MHTMEQVAPPTAEDVLAYLGWPADDEILQQAAEHVAIIRVAADAYTRGHGFEEAPDGSVTCAEDIARVIVSAAARSLSNPTHAKRVEAGAFNEVPGSAASWSLLESFTLNGYRRRAA